MIDSETGDIYPSKTCMRNTESISLEIIATDRDGADDGRFALIVLEVFKLREENIVMLTLENQPLENIEDMLQQVSMRLTFDLRYLTYFAVPSKGDVEIRQSNADTRILIPTYGFGGNGSLLNANEIIEILMAADIDIITTYSSFEEYSGTSGTSDCNSDCNYTGLIVGISVLGALLILVSITAPLIWFFWLRYKFNETTKRDSHLSEQKLEEDFTQETLGTSSPVDVSSAPFSSNENERTIRDAEIIGIEINGATEESTSDYSRLNEKLMAILDGTEITTEKDSLSDRKKTGVTFNELVERIEVLTEDTKDSGIPPSDDEENSVRL